MSEVKRIRLTFAALVFGVLVSGGLARAESAVMGLEHDAVVTWAGWSPDETYILTASEDGTVRLWDRASGELVRVYEHGSPVRGASWDRSGAGFVSWTDAGIIYLWSLEAAAPLVTLTNAGPVRGVLLAPDDGSILSWGGEVAIVWSLEDDERLRLEHRSAVRSAEWSDDHAHILTFAEAGTATVWDASTGERISEQAFGRDALGAAWTAAEDRVLAWTMSRGVQVWRPGAFAPSLTLPHRTFVDGAVWNADETRILSWSADDTAKVWDAQSGREILTLRHIDWVEGARFSQDETRILSWSYDSVFLWADDGAKLGEFRHDLLVTGAVWNQNEDYVLSWGWDGTARVWDVRGLAGEFDPTPEPQRGVGPGDL